MLDEFTALFRLDSVEMKRARVSVFAEAVVFLFPLPD